MFVDQGNQLSTTNTFFFLFAVDCTTANLSC